MDEIEAKARKIELQKAAERKEKIVDTCVFALLWLSILTPPIAYPVAQRMLVTGPIISILLSSGYLFLWNRFGPSAISGMLNGIASVTVVFFNLVSIVLSIVLLLGHLAV